MAMRIWHVYRTAEHFGYDEYDAKVVIAGNEQDARTIAAEQTGDEGQTVWLDPEHSGCDDIGAANRGSIAGLVLASFRAG